MMDDEKPTKKKGWGEGEPGWNAKEKGFDCPSCEFGYPITGMYQYACIQLMKIVHYCVDCFAWRERTKPVVSEEGEKIIGSIKGYVSEYNYHNNVNWDSEDARMCASEIYHKLKRDGIIASPVPSEKERIITNTKQIDDNSFTATIDFVELEWGDVLRGLADHDKKKELTDSFGKWNNLKKWLEGGDFIITKGDEGEPIFKEYIEGEKNIITEGKYANHCPECHSDRIRGCMTGKETVVWCEHCNHQIFADPPTTSSDIPDGIEYWLVRDPNVNRLIIVQVDDGECYLHGCDYAVDINDYEKIRNLNGILSTKETDQSPEDTESVFEKVAVIRLNETEPEESVITKDTESPETKGRTQEECKDCSERYNENYCGKKMMAIVRYLVDGGSPDWCPKKEPVGKDTVGRTQEEYERLLDQYEDILALAVEVKGKNTEEFMEYFSGKTTKHVQWLSNHHKGLLADNDTGRE